MKRFICAAIVFICILMCGSSVDDMSEYSQQEMLPNEIPIESVVNTETFPGETEKESSEISSGEYVQLDISTEPTVTDVVKEEKRIQLITPNNASFYIGKNYSEVVADLLQAGFASVKTHAVNSNSSNSSQPNGHVFAVSIGGESSFKSGEQYDEDVHVEVKYHRQTRAKLPISSASVKTAAFQDLLKMMHEAGFTNITVEELYDLDPVAYAGKSMVTMIVNGKGEFNKDDEFLIGAPIRIAAHYPKDQYGIKISINFLSNLIFDKDSVKVTFGDEIPVVLEHGEDRVLEYRYPAGAYSLKFESIDDSDINGQLQISVSGDMEYSCDISCTGETIDIKNEQINIINQISNTDIKLPNSVYFYLRRNQTECVQLMKQLGFINVAAEAVHETLWGATRPEQVTRISIDGNEDFQHGDRYNENAKVVIYYHIPELKFSESIYTVTEGDSLTIPYYVEDGDWLDDISIKVRNKQYLTQNDAYSFAARAPGKTKIEAFYKDICIAKCDVIVELRIIPISSISIAESEQNVIVGSKFKIDYAIEPVDANYKDVTYSFSSPIVEQLDDGKLYSNASGDSIITITQDGRELGSVLVHAEKVAVEQIKIPTEKISVGVGRSQNITFSMAPENATCIGLKVISSNPKIVKVEFDDKEEPRIRITGISAGKATVTIQASKKVIAKKQITVTDIAPYAMKINVDQQKIEIGSSGKMTVNYSPADVTSKKVTWSSSDPKIIKINRDGSYKALAAGETTITVTHSKGKSGKVLLKVFPVEVEKLTLSSGWKEGKPFCKNDSMTLTAKVSPENATDKSIKWVSSDEKVATVSKKGVVKAISPGTATITATASNGRMSRYKITVDISPQKFKVSASIARKSNDHVGSNWSTGFTFNGEAIKSGSTISIMPGESFSVSGWAEEHDSRPDYGAYYSQQVLTNEMCKNGFTLKGEADVRENSGRYSGNFAVWDVTMKFTPVN